MSRNINYIVNSVNIPISVTLSGSTTAHTVTHVTGGSYVFSGVSSGIYNINIIDGSGCTFNSNITVPEDIDMSCGVYANVISMAAGNITISDITISDIGKITTNPLYFYLYKYISGDTYEILNSEVLYSLSQSEIVYNNLSGGTYYVILNDTTSNTECILRTNVIVTEIIPCHDLTIEEGCSDIIEENLRILIWKPSSHSFTYEIYQNIDPSIGIPIESGNITPTTSVPYMLSQQFNIGDVIYVKYIDNTSNINCEEIVSITITGTKICL